LSSIACDVAHDYILPHIPQNEKIKNFESAGLNFAASGAGFVAGLKILTGLPNQNILKAGLFGGGSKLVVDSIYHNYGTGTNSFIF